MPERRRAAEGHGGAHRQVHPGDQGASKDEPPRGRRYELSCAA